MQKRGYLIIMVVLTLMLIAFFEFRYTGNVVKEDKQFCNLPYYEYATGSCCLDQNQNKVCDVDEAPVEELQEEPNVQEESPVVVETITTQPEEVPREFSMQEGDVVNVYGKDITLLDINIFNTEVEAVFDVNGIVRAVYGTKEEEIINWLKVTTLRLVDDYIRYIVVRIEPFELGVNEHLVYVGDAVLFNGMDIRLRNVFEDEAVLIDIIDHAYKINIEEGSAKEVSGIMITNINSYYRDARFERYAILKLEKSE